MRKARAPNVVQLPVKPRKRKASPRKRPDEYRALNRSHKVRDGRPLILAVPDPRRLGSFIIGEGYWCTRTGAWFWANTAYGLAGCDSINDIYDLTGAQWMPMPRAPLREAA
jgi:hypothetical protein